MLLGLTISGNQGCVFAGIKLVGPIVAAIWQPSQPIITAAISMIFQWEQPNKIRIVGVLIAFVGCTCMILLGLGEEEEEEEEEEEGETTNNNDDVSVTSSPRTTTKIIILQKMVGHCLFFMNCLCASLYVILSKEPLKRYPSLTVVAWSYNFATIFMAITAWLISLSSSAMDLFVCAGDDECDNSTWWKLPLEAILPLIYFIVFNSVIAHAIITWANQYATGTLVMGYTVLQPTTAALVTVVLLSMGYPNCQNQQQTSASSSSSSSSHTPCLEGLGWNSILGMVGVISGLALVIVTEPTEKNDDDEHTTTTTKMDDDEEQVYYKQMPEGEIL